MKIESKACAVAEINKKLRESKESGSDVYLDDDLDTVYDIEMQTEMKSNLPKRSRYYQGMIDLNIGKRVMIMTACTKAVCNIHLKCQDPFKMGRHIYYIFENMCRNVKTPLALNDGTYKVFLNADGTEDVYLKNGSIFKVFEGWHHSHRIYRGKQMRHSRK